MNLLIFLMVNALSGRGHSMISLSPNEQNSSLVRTCSILVTLSRPSNVRNFTSIPPPTSNNQLHKCSAEYLSYPPLYIWYHLSYPTHTYGIIYHIPPIHMVSFIISPLYIGYHLSYPPYTCGIIYHIPPIHMVSIIISPLYIWYQLFRFRSSKLYARFR